MRIPHAHIFNHHTPGGHGYNTDAAEGRSFRQVAACPARDSSLRDDRHHEGVRHVRERYTRGRPQSSSHVRM
ncbi:MAG TPA: hypothetical protein VIR01_18720, partial [Pyrinomonadaceae bacterium]